MGLTVRPGCRLTKMAAECWASYNLPALMPQNFCRLRVLRLEVFRVVGLELAQRNEVPSRLQYYKPSEKTVFILSIENMILSAKSNADFIELGRSKAEDSS